MDLSNVKHTDNTQPTIYNPFLQPSFVSEFMMLNRVIPSENLVTSSFII
jgi:hypothetical protein